MKQNQPAQSQNSRTDCKLYLLLSTYTQSHNKSPNMAQDQSIPQMSCKAIITIAIFLLSQLILHTKQHVRASYLDSHAQHLQQQQAHNIINQQPHNNQPLLFPTTPPTITLSSQAHVQENQRHSIFCTISSGDLPVIISWLKDGQLLTPSLAQAKKITIKPEVDLSTLKFTSVRLDHAGNYTCVAKNEAGIRTQSTQLLVFGEPRWVREPHHEPITAIRGQTIVIDCQTTGWPKPNQTWQIKTHQQSGFEPIAATGRISLAANGSLVIRNADKSDEANYLCRSSNGIGNGITWSTSLKVTVPAHFESNKKKVEIVRKNGDVQLKCDAFGDEPITIEWYKNGQRVTNDADPRYFIHSHRIQNGQLISVLNIKMTQRIDNSLFECVTRNSAGRDKLPIELLVQEEPDSIQELQASQINSRSVTLLWSEPYDGRSAITNYMFQFKRVHDVGQHSLSDIDFMDTSIVPSAMMDHVSVGKTTADEWQHAQRLVIPVQPNSNGTNNPVGQVRSISIEKLEPSSKYVLRALAINAVGQSKFSQPMEFSTEEEAPEVGPSNIRAIAINSTSIQVSWDEIPRGKQFGRIDGYYIGYRVAIPQGQNGNSTQTNFIYKPYVITDHTISHHSHQSSLEPQRLEKTIQDLRRDTPYEITVVAFNSRGSGPSSDFVTCRTIEMEVPRPVKVSIRRESNDSIFIEWHRDPLDQNPVDDYVLYQEKNSASQEWLQVRLPGNQSQYKAPGLKCGTRYQFYIIAHNKVGKSLPSEVVGASTSGALPIIPSKTSLIKMVNSTCLSVNLNSFQDNGCRIRTFTVRYRIEKNLTGQNSTSTLVGSNGLMATHQALSAGQINKQSVSSHNSASPMLAGSEWITIRPKSNAKHQRANEEDRIEYLCDLSPIGEYTIHVAATNDVGRSEVEYLVLMASDELRHSLLREAFDFVASLPNAFAYVPSVMVFLFAVIFLIIVSLVLYATIIKYYQKFVIMQNQIRATRRAKKDEKRRRKLNHSRHSQKHLDLWAEDYDDDLDDTIDDDDGDDDMDEDSSTGSHNAINRRYTRNNRRASHYSSNISNCGFDMSSVDSPCNKYTTGTSSTCMSTASTDSLHGRFQCLNSKQFVKMNEYTMLPSISAGLSPPSDIYGTKSSVNAQTTNIGVQADNQLNADSLYYSTLRRTNMQTYLPRQRQPGAHHAAHQHRALSQNVSDIYGYYMSPPQQTSQVATNTSQAQQAADEAANSIFVPPHQIIYSAPNIRRQPVFL